MEFRRDGVTWLVHAQLAVWGWFLFGFAPVVPLLREEFDVSRPVAGLHGSLIAAGAVAVGLTYARLSERLGRGRVAWIGLGGLCAGVLVLAAGQVLAVTLLGAAVAGVFGAMVVVGSAPILTEHHGPRTGPAAVTETNAVAAGAGLLAPAVIGGCVAAGWGWRVALALAVIPAAVAVATLRHARVGPAAPVASEQRRAPLPRRFWVAWCVLVSIVAIEFSMTLWSSDVLRERVGLDDGAATASVAAILGGMFVGRLAGGRLAERRGTDRTLLAALVLTAAGFALFWLSTHPALAVAGLAVTGLGMSVHYPLAITRALRSAPGDTDRAAGRLAVGAGSAGILAPVLLGAAADATGPHTAFLGVPALLAIAAFAVLRS
ncbi:MAG: MFS transporter [Sporichthyaceae bacterium]